MTTALFIELIVMEYKLNTCCAFMVVTNINATVNVNLYSASNALK